MEHAPRKIVFETDFEDRAEAIKLLCESLELRKIVLRYRLRSLVFWVSILAVLLAGSALVTALLRIPLRSPFYGCIATFLVLWACTGFYRYVLSSGVKRRVTEAVYDGARAAAGPGVDGVSVIELTEEALIQCGEHSVEEIRWPCVRSMKRDSMRGLVMLIDGRCLLIPVRAFGFESEKLDAFLDELARLNAQAGGWDGIVARFLRDYKSRCVGCGYELHGIGSARCPECGRPIEHEDFRSAWTERVTPFDPAAW